MHYAPGSLLRIRFVSLQADFSCQFPKMMHETMTLPHESDRTISANDTSVDSGTAQYYASAISNNAWRYSEPERARILLGNEVAPDLHVSSRNGPLIIRGRANRESSCFAVRMPYLLDEPASWAVSCQVNLDFFDLEVEPNLLSNGPSHQDTVNYETGPYHSVAVHRASAKLVEIDHLPLQQCQPHQHLSHSALPVYPGFQSGSCTPSADAVKHANHQMSEGTSYNRRMEIREKLAELHAAVLINHQSKSTTLECQSGWLEVTSSKPEKVLLVLAEAMDCIRLTQLELWDLESETFELKSQLAAAYSNPMQDYNRPYRHA